MRKTISFLTVSVATLLAPLTTCFANPASERIVIVLDASGSMWGQIQKNPKISIAKNVVKELLQGWDESVELGLTAYGHRKKGDCNDIESLVPVSPLNKDAFAKTVDAIQPKGKTPLSAAVRTAAEELKYTEERATVILVSDGIETCDEDPCALSKQLEESGVDFTTHVVGFDISKKEEVAQLKCIADNTGGKFLAANDADSLKSALDSAVKEVVKEKSGVNLVAVTEPGGKPLDSVYWEIRDSKEKRQHRARMGSAKDKTPIYRLEPGKYLVKVKSRKGKASAQKEIEVLEGAVSREEVVIAEEGEIQLVAVTKEGEKPLESMYWTVFEPATDDLSKPKRVAQGKGPQPTYRLLPGKYRAKVKSTKGKASAEADIEVIAGKSTRQEVIIAEEGEIELVAVTSAGAKPLSYMYWKVLDIPERELDQPKVVASGRGPTPRYRLLPGKYRASVKSVKGQATAEQEIEVVAGKRNRIEVIIAEEGLITLVAVPAPGGKPIERVYWQVFQTPENELEAPKQIHAGGGNTPTYRLLPGKYLARAKARGAAKPVEKMVLVEAGKKLREEIVLATE